MPQKYQIGQVVYSIFPPFQELVIMQYSHKIYYCNLGGNLGQLEKTYYEGELRIERPPIS